MSSFFDQELWRLFGDGKIIDSPACAGRSCLGTLGRDLRVRAQFVSTHVADEYDALKLTVLNRTDGPVDTLVLKLRDLLGKKPVPGNPNFREGVTPHIWKDYGKFEWYAYRPTDADYETIRQAAAQYLSVFREQALGLLPDLPTKDKFAGLSGEKALLQRRLEENYAVCMAQLTKTSFADLIEQAPEIAAARTICEELIQACTDSDAALLLRFDDPLTLMRDRWLDEMRVSHDGEIIRAIQTVRDRTDDFLTDYAPARPRAAQTKRKVIGNER